MRFAWNEAGIRDIRRWDSTLARMVTVANAVAEATIANAPERRGVLKGGVTVDAGDFDGDGAVARVGSVYAGMVAAEVGSVNNPPYGMYQRAIRECGLVQRF